MADKPTGEARTALSAAPRLGGENVFRYEEPGIVRLLLGSGDDPDPQSCSSTTRPCATGSNASGS